MTTSDIRPLTTPRERARCIGWRLDPDPDGPPQPHRFRERCPGVPISALPGVCVCPCHGKNRSTVCIGSPF